MMEEVICVKDGMSFQIVYYAICHAQQHMVHENGILSIL